MPAAPLGTRSLVELAALCHPAVKDHVHRFASEYMPEIRVACRFPTRDDDEQTGHRVPGLN